MGKVIVNGIIRDATTEEQAEFDAIQELNNSASIKLEKLEIKN